MAFSPFSIPPLSSGSAASEPLSPTVSSTLPSADLFKGIALFTPGGDLVYCIDPQKQTRWHMQLCAMLQEVLNLSEPPHFLVPCFTATIDRWLDPKTQQIRTSAEACPLVLRHQALLNALFGVYDVVWDVAPRAEEVCNPSVLESYRSQFPQLWDDHDLVIRFERSEPMRRPSSLLSWSPLTQRQPPQGYVFRLFVAGSSAATERTLQTLHTVLETSLQQPYTLKVVDIYKHPELAEADQISATPTLVKVWPKPTRRIVGDFGDREHLLRALIATAD